MKNKARIDKLARKNGLKLWSLKICYLTVGSKFTFVVCLI